MKTRLWLTRHLGAPANAEPAAQAEDWLRGRADLLIAGTGRQRDVLLPVELDVLAGRADISTRAGVISHLRNQLPLPGLRRRPARRPRPSASTA